MRYINGTLDFKTEKPTVITFGKFDGIHRGHETLMACLSEEKKRGLQSCVFTFDIPPRQGISEEDAKVLTTNREKAHMLEMQGIDILFECPFTPRIRNMEPEQFIGQIVERLNVKCIVAGSDFHFGKDRRGDTELIKNLAGEYGYRAVIFPKMQENHRDISSTYVREEIQKGNIGYANRLLGYRYFISGEIVHGNRIGRTIGIPTINLLPPKQKLLPPHGVYITEVSVRDMRYRGVTNVGIKPTIEGERAANVETHLLDFDGDLYGSVAVIEFIRFLREEKKFADIAELKSRMRQDIDAAASYFDER